MSSDLDPRKLEEGLEQLRELGYLRTPASAYVARRVAGRQSMVPAVLASSLWLGAGTGLAFSILMVVSAVISDDSLLGAPRSLLLLFFQLALVLTVIFALVAGLFSSAVLFLHRRGAPIRGSWTERFLVLVPGLLATVYLVDRVGRALLEGADPGVWGAGAALLVLVAAFFATVFSGAMRGALAMVRLQLHGTWTPPRISAVERFTPGLVGMAVSILLVITGPYRPGDRLPWFDEVTVQPVAEATRLVLVGVDGLPADLAPEDARPGVAWPELTDSPTAYWNEIATGFSAREHGLVSPSTSAPRGWGGGGERLREDPLLGTLVSRLMPGLGLAEQHAADRRELKRPPVWEIAARGGRRTRVVNWWGSYPAVVSPGLEIVSDRQWLRHSAGAELDSSLAAPAYLLLDEARFEAARARYAGEIERFTPLLDELEAPREIREVFALAATADLFHVECAADAEGTDFVALLLTGCDVLLRAGAGVETWDAAASVRLRSTWLDYIVERLLESLGPATGDLWVLGVERELSGAVSGTWGVGPWPGRPAAMGAAVLERLGIPAAADMAGASVGGPETYGLLRPGEGSSARVAPDLEQLKSLGYIGD
jgi:hypothetical protein